jgi:hypothetical protein
MQIQMRNEQKNREKLSKVQNCKNRMKKNFQKINFDYCKTYRKENIVINI